MAVARRLREGGVAAEVFDQHALDADVIVERYEKFTGKKAERIAAEVPA